MDYFRNFQATFFCSKMSANTSPLHYNELENAYISDANFKVDISQKMKVPHKISFNQDLTNGDKHWSEDINMQVPERILVAGHHQHIGKILILYYVLRPD